MKSLFGAAFFACLATVGLAQVTVIEDFSGGVTAANHPYPGTPVAETWYDITSDASGTAGNGTLSGSAALKIDDGGFTNGVYAKYVDVVPQAGVYQLEVTMKVNEGPNINRIRNYQVGVTVNGDHRTEVASGTSDLDPAEYYGQPVGYLTTGDDSAKAPVTVQTQPFNAAANDDLVISFSTDVVSGNFDLNSSGWGSDGSPAAHMLIDDIKLVQLPDNPVEVTDPSSNVTAYPSISDAINYINGQPAGNYVIDVLTNNLTEDTQIVIDNAGKNITINGDGNADDIPCDLLINLAAIEGAADVGNTTRHVIELSAAADIEINDLLIHPDKRGGTAPLVNPFGSFKPSSGTGNYTLNNVRISGSPTDGTAYQPVDSLTDIYGTTSKIWYGYSAEAGTNAIYNLTNDGGAGSYNISLNNCHGGYARSEVLLIKNQSGTTTVNGGVFGHTGSDAIRIEGTNVTLTGSYENRLRVLLPNRSSVGKGVRVVSGAQVDLIEYVDSAYPSANSSMFDFTGGTVTEMRYCRAFANNTAGVSPVTISGDASIAFSDCTFYSNGPTSTTPASNNPVTIASGHSGTVSFTNCIFASDNGGQILNSGSGTYSIANSAIPTDGVGAESLNATTPYTGTWTVTDPVSVSPGFDTSPNFSITNAGNVDYLRPTNSAAYTGAGAGGTNLTGGAGGTAVPVTLSGFTIE